MPSFTCVTHRFLKLTVKGHKGSACKRDYLAHKGTDRGCSTDTYSATGEIPDEPFLADLLLYLFQFVCLI